MLAVSVDVFLPSGKVEVRLKRKHKTKDVEEKIRAAALKSASGSISRGSMLKRSARKDRTSSAASDEARLLPEDGVLMLQNEDGSTRVCEPDENPLRLLLGDAASASPKSCKRKLLFMARQQGETVSPRASLARSSSSSPAPVGDGQMYPTLKDSSSVSFSSSSSVLLPQQQQQLQQLQQQNAEVVVAAAVVVEEVSLASVLRLNDMFCTSQYGAAAAELARHEWLHQIPILYDFNVEVRAMDAVNASSARSLHRAHVIERSLRASAAPPPVNRATKPK
jgi:outer membrane protein OmpA-like peptidoglycan-associated protein